MIGLLRRLRWLAEVKLHRVLLRAARALRRAGEAMERYAYRMQRDPLTVGLLAALTLLVLTIVAVQVFALIAFR